MDYKTKYKRGLWITILLGAILWIPIHPNALLAKDTLYLDTLDRFDSGYHYKIYLKDSKKPLYVEGRQLKKDTSGLTIESAEGTSHIDDQDIVRIKGKSNQAEGRQVLKGALYGAATGATLGLIPAVAIWTNDCQNSGDVGDCKVLKGFGGIFLGGGIAAGTLIGAGIGALVPKYHKVQIMPSFQPTQAKESARVGLQFSSNF